MLSKQSSKLLNLEKEDVDILKILGFAIGKPKAKARQFVEVFSWIGHSSQPKGQLGDSIHCRICSI